MLNKEINLNKKIIVFLIFICVLSVGMYSSYAYYEVSVIKNSVIVLKTASINITTTVVNQENNTFTIPKGSSITLTVNLTTELTNQIAYKMYYEVVSGVSTFNVTSTTTFTNDIVEGDMTSSKSFSFTFTNTGLNDITIKLGTQGGLTGYPIPLEQGIELKLNETLGLPVKDAITTSVNNPSDTSCKTKVEEDDITYISGTKTCINFNYVWYSGKLWRITAINPDGTMKMITDDPITTISYNPDVNFYDISKKDDTTYTGSYMYQWLNEDFLDTLYNKENMIVENSTWNITQTTDIATKLLNTNVINNATINKNTPVGLLNTYEYYLSYKNTTEWYSYLSNNNTIFWLLNPYSSTQNWCVNDWTHDKSAPTQFLVVRPVINLKANVAIKSGDGTVNNPYKLIGDKEDAKANTTLINTRNSGEYVKFNDELYRIVNIENKKTKIIKYDYVKNGTDIVLKKFGTDVNYGNGDSDDYADYYLNNTWYNSLTTSSKNLLETNNYYLGESYYGQSYKNSICITKNTIETIKSCQKTTSIWNGKIGLPRLGEMFASQDSVNGTNAIWIITKAGDSIVWNIEPGGYSNYNYPNATYAIRPSIYLKSNIVITNGDGTRSNPFEIALK